MTKIVSMMRIEKPRRIQLLAVHRADFRKSDVPAKKAFLRHVNCWLAFSSPIARNALSSTLVMSRPGPFWNAATTAESRNEYFAPSVSDL